MSKPSDLAKFANTRGADQVVYDNTGSGLVSTEVQGAIDEMASRGLTIDATVRTGNFAAVAGKAYKLDTSAGGFDITMPTSPADHSVVGFIDLTGSFAGFPAVLKYNATDKIMRLAEDMDLNIANFNPEMIYTGTANGWIFK